MLVGMGAFEFFERRKRAPAPHAAWGGPPMTKMTTGSPRCGARSTPSTAVRSRWWRRDRRTWTSRRGHAV